jgi:hypothetical protein
MGTSGELKERFRELRASLEAIPEVSSTSSPKTIEAEGRGERPLFY